MSPSLRNASLPLEVTHPDHASPQRGWVSVKGCPAQKLSVHAVADAAASSQAGLQHLTALVGLHHETPPLEVHDMLLEA
jgi:hypothetical protein